MRKHSHGNGTSVKKTGLSPQIGLPYGTKSKAAINLTFDLCCKAIAALFHVQSCQHWNL